MKRIVTAIALSTMYFAVACQFDDAHPVQSDIVFLQRVPVEGDTGDIFQFRSYNPGAWLVRLSPPTAAGELTVLCCDKAGS